MNGSHVAHACKRGWAQPTHTAKLSDGHTSLILVVFFNSFLAFLFSFWHLPTTAQLSTESVPPLVAEGDNVLILVNTLPENLLALAWFKGLTDMKQGIALYALHKNVSATGPVHSGRETIYHNGSLLIEKLTLKDTGFYTFRAYNRRGRVVATTSTYLHVQGK